MQHFFSYYPDNQSVTVPAANAVGLFGPLALPNVDREKVLDEAFENPINSKPLHTIVGAEDQVLIVLDDALEPTPAVFPFYHVIQELHKAGVKDSNISILIANNGHRANTGAEIDRKIGAEMHKKYRVAQSRGDAREQHSFGTAHTALGTLSVLADIHLRDATCIVSVSGVFPNRFKGFTGSGSVIFPGLTHEQTSGPMYLNSAKESTDSILGRSGTTVRTVIAELIKYIPSFKFAVDTVVDRTDHIVGCVTGDPLSAFNVSIDLAKRIFEVDLPEKADIIVTDSHPFDRNLLQAMHACYATLPLLKPQGEIIVVSPLLEALPHSQHELGKQLSQTRTHLIEESKKSMANHPRNAADLIAIAEVFERTSLVTFVTHGHGKADAEVFGFGVDASVQHALNAAIARKGANARIAIIQHGGLVFAHS
jgi:nickel-dependent lactate racemase